MKRAIEDVKNAISKYELWWFLGNIEIRQRYRRSVLGPWWITISMIIFITAMGIVFSKIFKQDLGSYIANFSTGFLFWTFFATSITESAELFRSNSNFIKQIDLPMTMYVFKHISKQIICLAHNFVVYILACMIFKIIPNFYTLLFIPGFLLFVGNLFWISFVISMTCTRFRDMVPIVNSCIQIAFFITPISWSAKLLSSDSKILLFNPIVYLIDLVRSPLLGDQPMLKSWIVGFWMLFFGFSFTLYLYSTNRSRIPFWVN